MTMVFVTMRKLIASLTAATFLFSCVFAQPIHAIVELRQSSVSLQQTFPSDIIPAGIGRITSHQSFGSNQVVINIQDLHCHAEVQRNISKILQTLDERYGLKKVYIEGASGDLDTSWLGGIKDKTLRNEIVETLVDQGRLTGTEYYSITSGKNELLSGLENEPVYRGNLVRLEKILERKPFFDGVTRQLRDELEGMKNDYFKRTNRRLERLVLNYKDGKINTEKYYTSLRKYVDKLNTTPGDIRGVPNLDLNDFPNIVSYMALLDQGRQTNYRKVTRELQSLIAVLKEKLPYQAYSLLLKKTNNFQRTDELYGYLAGLVKEYHLDLTLSYPALDNFLQYTERSKAINPIELIREEKRLVEELRTALAEDAGEQEVAFLSGFYSYVEDYLYNRLSADDYDYFKARFTQFRSLWAKHATKDILSTLSADFALLDTYYEINVQRNTCFLNTLSTYKSSQLNVSSSLPEISSPEDLLKNKQLIVMVTGGFHTHGLQKLLTDKKISYLAITPNVTQDTKTSSRVYLELAREQAKIFGQTLAQEPWAGLIHSLRNETNIEMKMEISTSIFHHLIGVLGINRLNAEGIQALKEISNGVTSINEKTYEQEPWINDVQSYRNEKGIVIRLQFANAMFREYLCNENADGTTKIDILARVNTSFHPQVDIQQELTSIHYNLDGLMINSPRNLQSSFKLLLKQAHDRILPTLSDADIPGFEALYAGLNERVNTPSKNIYVLFRMMISWLIQRKSSFINYHRMYIARDGGFFHLGDLETSAMNDAGSSVYMLTRSRMGMGMGMANYEKMKSILKEVYLDKKIDTLPKLYIEVRKHFKDLCDNDEQFKEAMLCVRKELLELKYDRHERLAIFDTGFYGTINHFIKCALDYGKDEKDLIDDQGNERIRVVLFDSIKFQEAYYSFDRSILADDDKELFDELPEHYKENLGALFERLHHPVHFNPATSKIEPVVTREYLNFLYEKYLILLVAFNFKYRTRTIKPQDSGSIQREHYTKGIIPLLKNLIGLKMERWGVPTERFENYIAPVIEEGIFTAAVTFAVFFTAPHLLFPALLASRLPFVRLHLWGDIKSPEGRSLTRKERIALPLFISLISIALGIPLLGLEQPLLYLPVVIFGNIAAHVATNRFIQPIVNSSEIVRKPGLWFAKGILPSISAQNDALIFHQQVDIHQKLGSVDYTAGILKTDDPEECQNKFKTLVKDEYEHLKVKLEKEDRQFEIQKLNKIYERLRSQVELDAPPGDHFAAIQLMISWIGEKIKKDNSQYHRIYIARDSGFFNLSEDAIGERRDGDEGSSVYMLTRKRMGMENYRSMVSILNNSLAGVVRENLPKYYRNVQENFDKVYAENPEFRKAADHVRDELIALKYDRFKKLLIIDSGYEGTMCYFIKCILEQGKENEKLYDEARKDNIRVAVFGPYSRPHFRNSLFGFNEDNFSALEKLFIATIPDYIREHAAEDLEHLHHPIRFDEYLSRIDRDVAPDEYLEFLYDKYLTVQAAIAYKQRNAHVVEQTAPSEIESKSNHQKAASFWTDLIHWAWLIELPFFFFGPYFYRHLVKQVAPGRENELNDLSKTKLFFDFAVTGILAATLGALFFTGMTALVPLAAGSSLLWAYVRGTSFAYTHQGRNTKEYKRLTAVGTALSLTLVIPALTIATGGMIALDSTLILFAAGIAVNLLGHKIYNDHMSLKTLKTRSTYVISKNEPSISEMSRVPNGVIVCDGKMPLKNEIATLNVMDKNGQERNVKVYARQDKNGVTIIAIDCGKTIELFSCISPFKDGVSNNGAQRDKLLAISRNVGNPDVFLPAAIILDDLELSDDEQPEIARLLNIQADDGIVWAVRKGSPLASLEGKISGIDLLDENWNSRSSLQYLENRCIMRQAESVARPIECLVRVDMSRNESVVNLKKAAATGRRIHFVVLKGRREESLATAEETAKNTKRKDGTESILRIVPEAYSIQDVRYWCSIRSTHVRVDGLIIRFTDSADYSDYRDELININRPEFPVTIMVNYDNEAERINSLFKAPGLRLGITYEKGKVSNQDYAIAEISKLPENTDELTEAINDAKTKTRANILSLSVEEITHERYLPSLKKLFSGIPGQQDIYTHMLHAGMNLTEEHVPSFADYPNLIETLAALVPNDRNAFINLKAFITGVRDSSFMNGRSVLKDEIESRFATAVNAGNDSEKQQEELHAVAGLIAGVVAGSLERYSRAQWHEQAYQHNEDRMLMAEAMFKAYRHLTAPKNGRADLTVFELCELAQEASLLGHLETAKKYIIALQKQLVGKTDKNGDETIDVNDAARCFLVASEKYLTLSDLVGDIDKTDEVIEKNNLELKKPGIKYLENADETPEQRIIAAEVSIIMDEVDPSSAEAAQIRYSRVLRQDLQSSRSFDYSLDIERLKNAERKMITIQEQMAPATRSALAILSAA